MLLSTSKMASFHGLKDENLNRQLERVSETRLLGNKFSDVNAMYLMDSYAYFKN